jgi:hypothetical protein
MIGILRDAIIVSFLSVVLITAAADADTVYLKNGGKITGTVIKESAGTVTIDIGGGTVVQNKSDIVRIKTDADALRPKESEALKAAEEESATPMLDTKKNRKGLFGIVGGVVDTAFSILKFDFLKKDK